jgi:hypothetical protein
MRDAINGGALLGVCLPRIELELEVFVEEISFPFERRNYDQ